MAATSTTIRVSRRAAMLADSNARMAELLNDPTERAAWAHETELSEASADELAPPDADTAAG